MITKKMIEQLARDEELTIEESIEFIDYNTMRALPYYKNAPIIIEQDYILEDILEERKLKR